MDNNIIGKRIRERRTELGYSLREFAKKINISSSFLSTLERGENKPSLDKIEEIAKGLQCPVIWLIGEEEVLNKINVLDNTLGNDLYDYVLNVHKFPNGMTYNEMDKKIKNTEQQSERVKELEEIINKLKTVIFPTKEKQG